MENLEKCLNDFLGNDERLFRLYSATKFCNREQVCDLADEVYTDAVNFYKNHEIAVNVAVFNFILEPIKNARFHTDNPLKPINIRLYLTDKSLLVGYSDGGSYFGKKDVKECWESKIRHPEKHISEEKSIGFGVGTRVMYEMADILYVDTIRRAMYAGLSVNGRFFSHQTKSI